MTAIPLEEEMCADCETTENLCPPCPHADCGKVVCERCSENDTFCCPPDCRDPECVRARVAP